MAIIKPFAALRPAEKYAEKVVSLPYDVMDRNEASEMAKGNPLSFLHISRSEIDLPEVKNPYDQMVYEKAGNNIYTFEKEGILIQDKKPMLYIYRQKMGDRVQTGLAACVSLDDYRNNIIKKHEFTRLAKEQDRVRHFDACNAHTEPVFLTYRCRADVKSIIDKWTGEHMPVCSVTPADGIVHTLWAIDDQKVMNKLIKIFEEVPSLYIADGHHRSASAVKVGLKRRKENPGYTGEEEFNFFMAVIFPDCDLCIYEYNRLVKDLNGHTEEGLLEKLSSDFIIEQTENGLCRPQKLHEFTMMLGNGCYKLTAKENIISEQITKRLDVTILQEYILDPILGIKNPRTDKRIKFAGGLRGLAEMERKIKNNEYAVAFALYPVSISDLLEVSDREMIMPPKSTWFEPKLGSGLLIHKL